MYSGILHSCVPNGLFACKENTFNFEDKTENTNKPKQHYVNNNLFKLRPYNLKYDNNNEKNHNKYNQK